MARVSMHVSSWYIKRSNIEGKRRVARGWKEGGREGERKGGVRNG